MKPESEYWLNEADKIVLAVVVGLCFIAGNNMLSKIYELNLQSRIATAEMAYTAAQAGVPLSEVTNRVVEIYRKNH